MTLGEGVNVLTVKLVSVVVLLLSTVVTLYSVVKL